MKLHRLPFLRSHNYYTKSQVLTPRKEIKCPSCHMMQAQPISLEDAHGVHVLLDAGAMCLHSPVWAKAKELSGNEIVWFCCDQEGIKSAFPIYVKEFFGGIRVGWVPHSLPHIGNAATIVKCIKKTLREAQILFLITDSYEIDSKTELLKCFVKVPLTNPRATLFLDLKGKNQEQIFNGFNSTTRKHIRRAEKAGFQCSNLDPQDVETFWRTYEATTVRKGFPAVCSWEFFQNLMRLGAGGGASAFQIIAFKAVSNKGVLGYIMGLRFGSHLLEFLRVNTEIDADSYGGKLLTWQLIKAAMESFVHIYDFGGINSKANDGISNFKRGFGGALLRSSGLRFLSCF